MDRKIRKKPNRAIVFRPHVTFRMLQGQEDKAFLRRDLLSYNHHLYRVFTAIPKVDNAPPFLHPYNYINASKVQADAQRLQRIDSENKKLLGRINTITRSPPKIDCWNTFCKLPSIHRDNHNKDCARRMLDNVRILKSIENAKSIYSKKDMVKRWKKLTTAFDESIKLSKALHTQKTLDKIMSYQPSLTSGLAVEFVLPRRKAFIDFNIQDGVRLGQVVVELYYEHAPKMVKNFLAHCDEGAEVNYKNCRIFRAKKFKYIALGDVTSNNGRGGHSIFHHNIELQPNDLKPTRAGLLLAMPVKQQEKFDSSLTIRQRIRQDPPVPKYNSQFAITLTACTTQGGKLPIFGKVVKGHAVLAKINDMLRKCGTPLVQIIVSRCGAIAQTKEEINTWVNVRAEMATAGVELDSSEGEESEVEEIAKGIKM